MSKRSQYLPRDILEKFSLITGISKQNLSSILSGKRNIGKQTALDLGGASKDLGYDFTASDWMFAPQKIRKTLINTRNVA